MKLPPRLLGAAVLVALLATSSSAQRPAPSPSTWAITDVRIEPVSGPTIANGTVVIRNGLIEAVGASVETPGDARVIDGAGMTVYPGFIDAATSLAIPTGTGGGQGGGQGQGQSRPTAPNSNYGIGMQAELRAVDLLDPTATSFIAARAAGFTAALTAYSSGIFRGSSAVIALRDGSVNELVVEGGVAQHLGYSRGGGNGGGFPSSLMGVFAQLRQQLIDAAHYRDVTAAYRAGSIGKQRPAHDPTLEALQRVISGEQPVVFATGSEREIRRGVSLAGEFGLRAWFAGGRDAWKVAATLAESGSPLLLDIDFPRRTAQGSGAAAGGRGAGGRGGSSTGSETPESMQILRDRVAQPRGAALLAEAGVEFVLTAGNDYGDFLVNLRRAVAGGLDEDRALRAITIVPATLFGVSDRLGSIEVGKIANLTIVTGDLFAEGGKVSQVFVDGVRFETTDSDSDNDTTTDEGSR